MPRCCPQTQKGGVPASDDLKQRVSVKQGQWELWTPCFFQGLLFPFTLNVSREILKWLMTHTWSLEPKVLFVCWAQGSDLCPNLLLLGPFLPRFQGLQGLNSLVYPQEEFNSCEGEKHLWLETIKFPLKEKKEKKRERTFFDSEMVGFLSPWRLVNNFFWGGRFSDPADGSWAAWSWTPANCWVCSNCQSSTVALESS